MSPEQTVIESTDHPLPRVRWDAILAGFATAIATWALFHVLGMGIGLTSVDPGGSRPLEGVATGPSVLALIAPVVGLFLGGLVVGRLIAPREQREGVLYGALVWATGTIAVLAILWTTAVSALGGATRVATSVAPAIINHEGAAAVTDTTGDRAMMTRQSQARAEQQVLEALDGTGKGLIAGVAALLLSLGASIGGASIGVRREHDRRSRRLTPSAAH